MHITSLSDTAYRKIFNQKFVAKSNNLAKI